MEACTRTLVAGAPTCFLRLQCSRSLVIVYTVTLDWLAAEQFCQNSERSYRLYSVQYSVQVYSAVYYWCTVDTWSLLHCTGMRSPHYGFVCKHRQGLLCMFSWKDRKEGLGLEFQFCHRYRDDYTTFWRVPAFASFQKLSKDY